MGFLNRAQVSAAEPKAKLPTISAVKNAEANKKFFDKDTMRFFGAQKFKIVKDGDWAYLEIAFVEKRPGETAKYDIDKTTLKLSPRRG